MLAVGDTAPAFQLEDTLGKTKGLSDFIATKPAVISFFKVSCPVCQFTFPFLERLSKSDNIECIGISQDDLDATEKFRTEYGVTFTTLLDPNERAYAVSNAYEIAFVPSTYLVEPDGQIAMSITGFSKRDFEAIGRIAGLEPFRPDENVPESKAG